LDIKRAVSKTRYRLELVGTRCERAWSNRAEDGRVRYAMAGLGLGLMAGSLLSAVADSLGLIDWESVGPAPITLLGFVVGLALLGITVAPRSWTEKTWSWERRPRQLSHEILKRATEDSEFREQLKADPRRTIEREFPVTILDGCEITVLEERPQHAYIVLPVQPSELSREQPDAASALRTDSKAPRSQGTR
jgi:hypothetical protein